MSFRFRKSINLGFGLRLNFSKSGIGFSWGVPGIRFTKTAKGKNRTTYSIPNTGLSYTKESGTVKHPARTKTTTLYCCNCGKKISKTAKFCQHCGSSQS